MANKEDMGRISNLEKHKNIERNYNRTAHTKTVSFLEVNKMYIYIHQIRYNQKNVR